MNDDIRMLIVMFFNTLAPVLRIFGVVEWTAEETAAISAFVIVAVTIFFRVWKSGAGQAGPLGAGTVAPIVGAVALLVAFAAMPAPRVALAAVDCATPHGLTIEVYDTDENPDALIDTAGARVRFTPDPLDGIGTRTISDQGAFDDGEDLGRIQIEEACSGAYVVELLFSEFVFSCDVEDPEREANNVESSALIVYEVNDCAAVVRPTATPTATATPIPATHTPAPPAATAVPATPQPPVIIVIPAPTTVPAAPVVTAAPASVIRPPNTGSGGLASWGDENDGASLFDSYCPGW